LKFIIHELPRPSFTHNPSNHSQLTLAIIYTLSYLLLTNYPTFTNCSTDHIQITLPVVSDLPDLFTNHPTSHSQIILLPIAHKLPHLPFTNYPTNRL